MWRIETPKIEDYAEGGREPELVEICNFGVVIRPTDAQVKILGQEHE